jgi:hypothetical protein
MLKVNGDLISKYGIDFSKAETFAQSEKISIEYDEDFFVAPLTLYTYIYNAEKGMLAVPMTGRIVLDALVKFRGVGPIQSITWWLSHEKMLPNPESRYIDFDGTLINENYSNLVVVHHTAPIDPSSPICQVADQQGMSVTTSQSIYCRLDGSVTEKETAI